MARSLPGGADLGLPREDVQGRRWGAGVRAGEDRRDSLSSATKLAPGCRGSEQDRKWLTQQCRAEEWRGLPAHWPPGSVARATEGLIEGVWLDV